jgi:methionyl-tRNA formyltransferase
MAAPRTVFIGSPADAVPALRTLLEMEWPVEAVYTAPDRRAGRGLKLAMPPVKQYALEAGLPVRQPTSLRSEETLQAFQDLAPDLVVVAAYGRLLPAAVLSAPLWGCVNLHPSLLPRHRGASPVAAAILDGDQVTGVSLMLLDEGVDTGPILTQREEPVRADDATPGLMRRLFERGAVLLEEALPLYVTGRIKPTPQPQEGVSVSRKLVKEDGEIDWGGPASYLERQIRAYLPWPGSASRWRGERVEVLEAQVVADNRPDEPGTVVELSLAEAPAGVVTGDGVLALRRIKMEGRTALGMTEFLRGHPGFLGTRLPS